MLLVGCARGHSARKANLSGFFTILLSQWRLLADVVRHQQCMSVQRHALKWTLTVSASSALSFQLQQSRNSLRRPYIETGWSILRSNNTMTNFSMELDGIYCNSIKHIVTNCIYRFSSLRGADKPCKTYTDYNLFRMGMFCA